MKKISFLMLHFGYGGVESAIANQANMLCNNYQIEIVSLYKLNYISPHVLNKKIKLIYLSELKPNKEEFLLSLKQKDLLRVLKEGIKSLKILYLKKKLMKKYIKSSDANIIVSTRFSFNKLLGKNAKKGVIKIAQEHVYHNNNYKYINSLIKSLKNIDYLLPVSKELTDFYSDKVSKNTKCTYIKHALDFNIEKYNYKSTNNLIAVARLSKEKGFLDLIEVIELVKKDIPDIKLHLIGDGLEKDNIKNKISNLNLGENVIMYGYKQRKEINKIIKNCSLYCMTSFEESFGLSVIEAMAFGLPCIAFDTAKGVLEIIDKDCGIIIKNRNKQKMAQEIINLLKDQETLKKISQNAYEKSIKYSFENVKKDWLNFYYEVTK